MEVLFILGYLGYVFLFGKTFSILWLLFWLITPILLTSLIVSIMVRYNICNLTYEKFLRWNNENCRKIINFFKIKG